MTRATVWVLAILCAGALAVGCADPKPLEPKDAGGPDTDTDTDTDTDSDSDTDTDTDSDTDTDTDIDTDTDTDTACTGDGVWYDTVSELCWRDPPSDTTHTWTEAPGYCTTLGAEWRVPSLSELRSLVRGCTLTEWDLVTVGCEPPCCGVCDECADSACWDDWCDGCVDFEGPDDDPNGCYWDPALSGSCSRYWSVTESSMSGQAWSLYFNNGAVYYIPESDDAYVRCVRGGT